MASFIYLSDNEEDGHAAKRMKLEEHGQGGNANVASDANMHSDVALSMAGFDPNMLTGLTAEQITALQHAGMPMLTPEMLAAAMQQPPMGPDGQPLQMQFPILSDMGGQFGGGFDAAALSMAGMPPLPGMDVLQQLPPEQLQAFIQNPGLTQFLMPAPFAMPSGSEGNSTYKNWWDEKDEQELMQMVSDTEYRREKLGTDELDWAKLETYFNRSQNALRKKFWMLSKGAGGNPAAYGVNSPGALEVMGLDASAMATAAAAAAAAMASSQPIAVAPPSAHPRTRAERKNWSEEETVEMVRIVSDADYRAVLGLQHGEEEVSWEKLGTKFNCTVQTAKRKYRHLQEQASHNNGIVPDKKKREHYRKSVPYRWMIVSALSKIAGFEATAPQIFESIEQDPELRGQLDTRIMPGTKHVPRWKIQIRKVLSADHIFINTGVKQKHETIWRLDPVALQEANADRQRQRAGVPPINLNGSVDNSSLPQAPALTGTGPDAMAALHQLPMGMPLNEQTLAMLQQQQHHLIMGMQPGQTLQLGDGQHLQLLGLPEGAIIDPATLAAMISGTGAMPPFDMHHAVQGGEEQGHPGALEQQHQQQEQQQQQQGGEEHGGAAVHVHQEGGHEGGGVINNTSQQDQHHAAAAAAAVAMALAQDPHGLDGHGGWAQQAEQAVEATGAEAPAPEEATS